MTVPQKALWLLAVAVCAGFSVAASLRERIEALRANAVIHTNAPPVPPATNITLGWSYAGPTNTDVCLYSTTNLRAPFPAGYRLDAILPARTTNITFLIKDRERFWRIDGYDPANGLMSFSNRWMP